MPVLRIGLDVDGPASRDYLIRDELQEGAFSAGMCDGGTVTVSTEARIQVEGPSDSNQQMTTDSMDGHVTLVDCSST
jgi:hypothetical protein